jgi:hypothetical protein
MKNSVFILILILLIIKSISSIQPKSYCFKPKGKCNGKYKKTCGRDFCAVNSESCTQLVKYNYYIEEILNPKPKLKQMLRSSL